MHEDSQETGETRGFGGLGEDVGFLFAEVLGYVEVSCGCSVLGGLSLIEYSVFNGRDIGVSD